MAKAKPALQAPDDGRGWAEVVMEEAQKRAKEKEKAGKKGVQKVKDDPAKGTPKGLAALWVDWRRRAGKAPVMRRGRLRDVWADQHQLSETADERRKGAGPYVALAALAGVLVFCAMWAVVGLIEMGGEAYSRTSTSAQWKAEARALGVGGSYVEEAADGFWQVESDGGRLSGPYASADAVPEPDWHARVQAALASVDGALPEGATMGSYLLGPTSAKLLWATLVALVAVSAAWAALSRQLRTQNQAVDIDELADCAGDQLILTPMELMQGVTSENLVMPGVDLFPDAGAHSSVSPNRIIGHVMFQPNGCGKVSLVRRHSEDVLDEEGEVLFYKGEPVLDDDGEPVVDALPVFDGSLQADIFDVAQLSMRFCGDPAERRAARSIITPFNPAAVEYNPDKRSRDRLPYRTVADLVKGDWHTPAYERQRPAGAFIVGTDPANTLIIARTRAGKGQTWIEHLEDIWSRESSRNNIITNDPKGELARIFSVPHTIRGYEVVRYNLMKDCPTDVFNLLHAPCQAARKGEYVECAQKLQNLAEIFFPNTPGVDKVWIESPRNQFLRITYGLIDYYMEEEAKIREEARRKGTPAITVEHRVDELWAHVTPYNVFKMFSILSAMTVKSPVKQADAYVAEAAEKGRKVSEANLASFYKEARRREFLWEGADEVSYLDLYFNATAALPENGVREQANNADKSLRQMGDAKKMMASVNSIVLSALRFFSDPTVMKLTSGKPSQNVDLEGLSFPRRFGVRFNRRFFDKRKLKGRTCRWRAYADADCKVPLEPVGDWSYDGNVTETGWSWFYFKGTLPEGREHDTMYVELKVLGSGGNPLRTLRFRFTRGYATSFDGLTVIHDEIAGKDVVRGGVLEEMRRGADGTWSLGRSEFTDKDAVEVATDGGRPQVRAAAQARPLVRTTQVFYSERPYSIFFVTPPHLRAYAKIIMVFIKEAFDTQVSSSYLTTKDGKPFRKTRYMLDEFPNLVSDGQGIEGFDKMLAIGLGQGQEFNIVTQSIKMLTDIYGESMESVLHSNCKEWYYIHSQDENLLRSLSAKSGEIHRVHASNKSITQDSERVFMSTEGHVNRTYTVDKENVVKFNDFAFTEPCNAIVFTDAGPVWARNEMAMPMSFVMQEGQPIHPGGSYTLKTLPTNSTAADFDVANNVPDFVRMVTDRVNEAAFAPEAEELYRKARGLSEFDAQLEEPDSYASDVMEVARLMAAGDKSSFKGLFEQTMRHGRVDVEQQAQFERAQALMERLEAFKLPGVEGFDGRELLNASGLGYSHAYDAEMGRAMAASFEDLVAPPQALFGLLDSKRGVLASLDGKTVYARRVGDSFIVTDALKDMMCDPERRPALEPFLKAFAAELLKEEDDAA